MTDLPTLEERRIDEMEDALFADIARERDEQRSQDAATAASDARRRRRRRTWWGASGAAAAVLVVAVAISPQLSGLGGTSSGSAMGGAEVFDAPTGVDPATGSGAVAESAPFVAGGADGATRDLGSDIRDVVATANATVRVDDPREGAQRISDAATAAGGYVESLSVSAADGATGAQPVPAADSGMIVWPPAEGSAWVTVRVPASELPGVIDGLGDIGEVESSQVTRDDVTTQAVDLRARVASGEASVARLTELLAQAGSVSDLIAAESALAERQADLESLQQQLESLESQVAMSSLSVSLVAPTAPVDADPAGFGDGLAAGWNGLVATLNGVIVALGFLLPWALVAGVAAALVWLVVRLVRRRRRPAPGA
ncbi:MAG: DUF4349 domain-containing protein [Microbacterium arborescens]